MQVRKYILQGTPGVNPGFQIGAPNPDGMRTFAATNRPPRPSDIWEKIVFPKAPDHVKRPITTVAIAEDSPVSVCDLYIGGRDGASNRFRLSPGSPYVGEIEDDHAYICPVRTIYAPFNNADTGAKVFYWELGDTGIGDPAGSSLTTWPQCKVNAWRGDQPSPVALNVRATYDAQFNGRTTTTDGFAFCVCVDGRRSWEVLATAYSFTGGATTSTLKLFGFDGHYNMVNGFNGPSKADRFSAVLLATVAGASGNYLAYEDQGRPFSVLMLEATTDLGGCDVAITVRADDY